MPRKQPITISNLRVNPDWAKLPLFNRKGWTRVRFGDVVQNLNETERNSAEAGLERFIGLEHLESGSLHIQAWGNVADGTTFTRRCRPGQVLFGKRRAYQRKVAVADFNAVVSGDIYVLSPKDDRLLSELLPFLCLTECFYQYAVGTSAGSLSPRTNWNSLASFEFDLPPFDQQRRIAEMLWVLDMALCGWETNRHSIFKLHELKLRESFENSIGRWPSKALGDIARVERGKFSHRPRNLPEFYGGEFPFVQTGDVQKADRILKRFDYQLTELGTTYSKSFPAGTIFVTIAAVIGATAISDREVFVTDSVVGVVPSKEMDVDYLELFLRYKRHFLENQAATQTAQKNVNLQILRPLLVPCPPRSVQELIAGEILAPLNAANEAQCHIEKLRSLFGVVINRIIGATS